jgi:energy-coupling factor transporter transmembrane protein EcfT
MPIVLDRIHPYAYAAIVILFIAFIFMAIGFIFSNISLCCVIRTQERRFKYLSNISWCSSSFSLILLFTAGIALSFSGPVLSDFCRIQDNQSQPGKADKYPRFASKELSKQLYQCIYSDNCLLSRNSIADRRFEQACLSS